jgi:hypothetical protein
MEEGVVGILNYLCYEESKNLKYNRNIMQKYFNH